VASLEQYADNYRHIRMERRDGILQMTFHTDGGPLQWGGGPHEEFPRAFADVGSDPANRVVIITGTGDAFSGPQGTAAGAPKRTPREWDKTYWEGKRLLTNLLDIEVPIIGAVNGPALRHSEIPLLSDIVLASETAAFQDSGHFMSGLVPGDGVHIVYPMLLGLNRGRYFLLTGQSIGAQEAQTLGLVNEVLPPGELLPRAWALAGQLAEKSDLVLRYTRVATTQYVKRIMQDLLGYGLALEGLGSADTLLNPE
jgi:enoyl-CoA hydratase/carnithine racemase